MKVEYINGNPEYGILYDWNLNDVLEGSGAKAYARGVKNE